ncbi:MAG: proline--tRNA ligase [Myxococcales bacterium]|nr:proline--tRNA ligase [Myxococcales bacterium]MCB9520653.1 proline--tRNA ligase [Myxococcales bacterium]
MRLSQLFVPTLKETPKEAEVVSHMLLLRAGYIRKLAAGIYNFLPLGIRSVRKVEAIVRQELNRAGAQEVLMPAVQPASIWKESGRWEYYGNELLRFKDRKGGEFCLGPTHEEVITDLVRGEVRSYRELPLNLYQIQSKFRDELRPRAGLMRGREFIMKDAYSFDVDEAAAKASYKSMYDAYCRIFDRCGLQYRPVEADTGAIGGNLSHEFQVLTETGEDSIVSCPSCGYTANVEKAELRVDTTTVAAPAADLVQVATPGARTITEVAALLGRSPDTIVKTLVFVADEVPVLVLVRGDLDVNEVKVKVALGASTIRMAADREVEAVTHAPVGFAGPVGLTTRVLADHSVFAIEDGVVGANAADAHLVGFCASRDAAGAQRVDVRLAAGGDACGRCGDGRFEFFRGIEVGQVFYLGTKYSEPMRCTFLDAEGVERPMVMGCYGVGITRILSAAIEQNHDADGIVWPMSLAPFHVIVAPLQLKEPTVVELAEKLYSELGALGVEVILDDRDVRPGVKFKDADLLGIPLRVTVGARGAAEGFVEVRRRGTAADERVAIDQVVAQVAGRVAAELGDG